LLFTPDKIFEKISEITAELLEKESIKGLVLDIDYTLAPKSEPLPDEAIIEFVRSLKQAGIKLYIISNNHKNRVSKFSKALELDFICNGLKPFPLAFRRAAKEMGLSVHEVAAVGDQIYTDVYGAHVSGMRAWLVSPNGTNKSLLYALRRRLEMPFINRYYKSERRKTP
jgi:HAD superfamily phosphatase (TIGR01668 family)